MSIQEEIGPETVAVIGAGVIGCAIAWSLAREGRRVLLIDRDEPGRCGASFGNVGHIAAELVEPLPSPQLLLGFWRELFAFGGPLSIPLARLPGFAPWAWQFARAAFRRSENTTHLTPLVKPASTAFERMLGEIGRPELLRRNGHYQLWAGPRAGARARGEALHMNRLGIPTAQMPETSLRSAQAATGTRLLAGLWFPDSAHVVDPFEVCRALARAAAGRGAAIRKARVLALEPRGERIALRLEGASLIVSSAVVCAGAWSAPLLTPFGLHVPLEAARGYHVEMPGQSAYVDAPLIHMDERILVTPMSGRLRASSYMEFTAAEAPQDARKPARLRRRLRHLGYRIDDHGSSWVGSRPVLPDYLPGIGRAPGPCKLFYAIGHQHLGLTMAPVTADLIADQVAERQPRLEIAGFDLRRFSNMRRGALNTPTRAAASTQKPY